MTDQQITIVLSILGALGAGFMKLCHWFVTTWAAIRREEIAERAARSAADRDASARRDDRHVAAMDRISATINDHTTRDVASQAEVKEAVARVEAKFDAALDWFERTPIGDVDHLDRPPSDRRRRRLRTVPEGHPALGADSRKNRTP